MEACQSGGMATFSTTLPLPISQSPRFSERTPPPFVPLEVVQDAPLDSIAIFRADAVTEGWTERSLTRPSDRLNRGLPIDVRYSADGASHPLAPDDVIALAVQVQAGPSPNRMARRRHVLELTAGPYRLRGIVHMPPAADPTRYLRAASQRWIPLTKATIVSGDDNDGYEIDVLLVNMDHVARV
jgi:hypothetical protein